MNLNDWENILENFEQVLKSIVTRILFVLIVLLSIFSFWMTKDAMIVKQENDKKWDDMLASEKGDMQEDGSYIVRDEIPTTILSIIKQDNEYFPSYMIWIEDKGMLIWKTFKLPDITIKQSESSMSYITVDRIYRKSDIDIEEEEQYTVYLNQKDMFKIMQ